ncbi:MAG: glycosyltransferase [Proteobacteria bacterium]|nr:MAG: glycosyltransferase [Pseudomonadota bacterium]
MIQLVPEMIDQFLETTPFALFGTLDDKSILRKNIACAANDWAAVKEPPLVSVIMPLYNSNPSQLEQAILSVLAQSYPRWELIAVDDGSPKKEHLRVIEKFIKAYPNQIFLSLQAENRGISAARNKAIGMSKGEYLAILDHDDIIHPLAISESIKKLLLEDANFSYSFEVKVTDDGRDLREFLSKPKFSWFTLLHLNYICHFSVLKRSLLNAIQRDDGSWFNSEFDGAEDHELFMRCGNAAGFKAVLIPQFLYLWRMTPESTSSNQANKPLSKNRSIVASVKQMSMDKSSGEEGFHLHPFRTHTYLKTTSEVDVDRVATIYTAEPNSKKRPLGINSQKGVKLENISSGRLSSRIDSELLNKEANSAQSEYLLFMNPNLEFRNPNILSECIGWLRSRPEIGSVGVSILDVPRVPGLDSVNLDAASYPVHTSYCIRENPGIGGGLRFSSFLEKRWFAFESRQVIGNTRHFLLVRRADFLANSCFDHTRFRTNAYDLDFCIRLEKSEKINVNLGFVGIEGHALDECKVGFGEPEQIYFYDRFTQETGSFQLCYNYAYNLNELRN